MAYYLKNEERNGIEIYFGGKPSQEVLTQLKANEWKWHNSKKCWYNKDTIENEELAKSFCGDTSFEHQKSSVPKTQPSVAKPSPQPVPSINYTRSKLRKDESIIERDLQLEASFGITDLSFYYYGMDNEITIVGSVTAKKPLKKAFCFICTLYDEDDDIIESTENKSYGSGLVTSMIKPECYFDGFPFKFWFYNVKPDVKRIKIVPAISY